MRCLLTRSISLVERVATDIMFADVDNQMHYICRKSLAKGVPTSVSELVSSGLFPRFLSQLPVDHLIEKGAAFLRGSSARGPRVAGCGVPLDPRHSSQ